MTGGLFDGITHFVVAIEVKDIVDQVERVLIVVHFSVQACQVEAVGQVLLIDFAKVLVAAGRDELVAGMSAGEQRKVPYR